MNLVFPGFPKVLSKLIVDSYLEQVDVYLFNVAFGNVSLDVPEGLIDEFLFTISKRGHEKLIIWFKQQHYFFAFNNHVCRGLAAGQHLWLLEQYKTHTACRDPEVIGLAVASSRDIKIIDDLEDMGFIVGSSVLRYVTFQNDLETMQKLAQKYFPLTHLFLDDYDSWWHEDMPYRRYEFIQDCLKYGSDEFCLYVLNNCASFREEEWLIRMFAEEGRFNILMGIVDIERIVYQCINSGSFETFQKILKIAQNASFFTWEECFDEICMSSRDQILKYDWLVNEIGVEFQYNNIRLLEGNHELLKHVILSNRRYSDDIPLDFMFIFDTDIRPYVFKILRKNPKGFLYHNLNTQFTTKIAMLCIFGLFAFFWG